MYDFHYILYQAIDKHPIIILMMLVVIYSWVNNLSRYYLTRWLAGDKKAKLREALYSLGAVWIMVAIFNVTYDHRGTITGQEEAVTYFHGHRYDLNDKDSLTHSSLCGCRANQNRYLPPEKTNAVKKNTIVNDTIQNESNTITPKKIPRWIQEWKKRVKKNPNYDNFMLMRFKNYNSRIRPNRS